ncbi:hypothetical protein PVAP13_6KG103300 [Panicum virgatum]|uniref:Inosine/uridine-preferring nucleoside hydrolase domain-containing protein n=1 Tax=Panicum virgatum TaxID=38727 RepID=A0A8T0RB61_PANVG|nr:hypothetical protein PVAP13_6KG103300 [Panicum virgatum]
MVAAATGRHIHHHEQLRREMLIIDTDPGVDDSVAIMAFQSPGAVQVLGLTTIFGNCTMERATRNALILCEKAGHPEIPAAEGSSEPLKGGKPHVADFVHGSDGLGNIELPDPSIKKFPGEVSVLALGPLTNIALAIKRDPSFVKNVKRIVVLGGAFSAAGNVTPAAEANIYNDPDAADLVFTCGGDIYVVGLNNNNANEDLLELRNSEGRHTHSSFATYADSTWTGMHTKSYGVPVVYLHDPVSFATLVRPDLFKFRKGVVRVETQGMGLKKWDSENPWTTGYSPISVAWSVDAPKVVEFVKDLITKK